MPQLNEKKVKELIDIFYKCVSVIISVLVGVYAFFFVVVEWKGIEEFRDVHSNNNFVNHQFINWESPPPEKWSDPNEKAKKK